MKLSNLHEAVVKSPKGDVASCANQILDKLVRSILAGEPIKPHHWVVGEVLVPRTDGSTINTEVWALIQKRTRSKASREGSPPERLLVGANGEAHNILDCAAFWTGHTRDKYWVEVQLVYELPDDIDTIDYRLSIEKPAMLRIISQYLDHELAHIARPIGTSQKKHKRYIPHEQLSLEWDANITSIVRYWERLSAEQRDEIKDYKQLVNNVDPALIRFYWDPIEWRKRLIASLVKNGIVIRAEV